MHGDLGLRSPWSGPGNAASTSHLLDWLIACSPVEPMCQHPGFSGLGLHIVVMEIKMYRAGSHCAGGGAEACIMAAVTWPQPGRTQRRRLLGPWSLVSPAFSRSHPFLRACSSGTRSSPSQPLVPSLRAELCPSSFAPHCPAALPAPLPAGRLSSPRVGYGTFQRSLYSSPWLGLKMLSLAVFGQSLLLLGALGPCVEN